MPRRECAEGGCRVLTETTRCPKHTKGDNSVKRHDRARNQNDPLRKLYGTARWKRTRQEVLMEEILCRRCKQAPADVADHIIPARVYCGDDEEKFFDRDNLQGLCSRPPNDCHRVKTGEDTHRYGLLARSW
jgi:5-methylcytosine-specific restriction endonuclease McrA